VTAIEPVAEALADRLMRRLLRLDSAARRTAARRALEQLPASRAVDVLEALLAWRTDGDPRATEALGAITSALSELGELDVASSIYAEARAREQGDVARLLMRPAPARDFDPKKEHGVDHAMRAKTVGMRRQMARTADPVVLMRLQTDPDPGVIRNLLDHPRLTEPEVVRMAARRPGRPEVLREIFRSRRWSVRVPVRKALANNPYTPTEIALKLVPLLPLPALRELAHDGNLHEEVRRSAGARLVEARHRREVARAAANLADLEPEGDA
jgi:hypothetical protein